VRAITRVRLKGSKARQGNKKDRKRGREGEKKRGERLAVTA